jgi:enamine deaminase RidA (YjgF/YER057c/UK114 family)
MSPEQQLRERSLELPPAPKSAGLYRSCIVVGNTCYTSGHIPVLADGSLIKGRAGQDADVATGQRAARQCGLNILATLRHQFGNLDRIKRLVKLLGFVQCTDDFSQQPAVMNGCSELMAEVFGSEAGVGARSAVGINALPMGVLVEVEAVFELHDD